jgi:hypothetical protein
MQPWACSSAISKCNRRDDSTSQMPDKRPMHPESEWSVRSKKRTFGFLSRDTPLWDRHLCSSCLRTLGVAYQFCDSNLFEICLVSTIVFAPLVSVRNTYSSMLLDGEDTCRNRKSSGTLPVWRRKEDLTRFGDLVCIPVRPKL